MSRLLWTRKQNVGPFPRAEHAMAFDSTRRRTVLFGGDSLHKQLFEDTWEWDDDNWTQMNDLGPGPRSRHAMAYDVSRQRVVLFGGTNGSSMFADTWEWNGEDWTQNADGGPSPRIGHAMVYDAGRNRIVLFGGESDETFQNDTWEWNGDNWVELEDTGPAPRRDHAMAFDASRDRIVLFGGTSSTQSFGDTWEWDGTVWTQVSSFGPPAGLKATLIWTGQRSLLYGGLSSVTGALVLFRNSWEWDGKHWTIRQDMGPGARFSHAMVFDSARQRGVLFGGSASSPISEASPTAFGDTWEQFEGGKESTPPPPAEGTMESVSVTPLSREEGMPVIVEIKFSAPTAKDVDIDLNIIPDTGGSIWSETVHLVAGARSMSHIFPVGLPAAPFTVTATAGAITRSAPFAVIPNTSLQLQSLTAIRKNERMIDVTVTLTGPVPTIPGMFADGLLVPLMVDNGLLPGVMVKRNERIGTATIPGHGIEVSMRVNATLGAVVREVTIEPGLP
jgi:hypothetical protein